MKLTAIAVVWLLVCAIKCCAGHYKYACEGAELRLNCGGGDGGHVAVYSAFYGEKETNRCGGTRITAPCTREVTKQIQKLCDGKASCVVTASNSQLLGDPCPGTHKYLGVRYSCL